MQTLQFSAFGLGTMVYVGLEFGSWFEIPWDSPCYQVSFRNVSARKITKIHHSRLCEA